MNLARLSAIYGVRPLPSSRSKQCRAENSPAILGNFHEFEGVVDSMRGSSWLQRLAPPPQSWGTSTSLKAWWVNSGVFGLAVLGSGVGFGLLVGFLGVLLGGLLVLGGLGSGLLLFCRRLGGRCGLRLVPG